MSRFHNDPRVREAAEQCAERETWLRLESNPERRSFVERALREAQAALAREIERAAKEIGGIFTPGGSAKGSSIFPEGNVTDIFKLLDERAARAREDAAARQAAELAMPAIAPEPEPHPIEVEREVHRLGEELVRELRAPPAIRELPDWAALHVASLQAYGNLIGAAEGPELASTPLPSGPDFDQAPELAAGEEMEGEVRAIIERDGARFYVIEALDDGRLAAAAIDPDGPEFEVGDVITASRDVHGDYEFDDYYGYGR